LTNRSVKKILIMPKTKKQFAEIREEKKSLIIETAIELFAEKGFHNTSISEIAKKAGISKGLMYNYYESKEDLLRKGMYSLANEFIQNIDFNRNKVLEKYELLTFLNSIIDHLKKNLKFWKFLYAVINQPVVFKILEKEMEIISEPMTKMLVKYFKSNGFKKPETEAAFLNALLNGVCSEYIFAPESFPINEVKKKIIEMYNLKSK